MAIPKGAEVRQIVKPVEGVVVGYHVDQGTGKVQIEVGWEEDGVLHRRAFFEEELEVVTPPGPPQG